MLFYYTFYPYFLTTNSCYLIDNKSAIAENVEALLVGVVVQGQSEQQLQEYLDELAFLATTAGAITKKRFIQKMSHPDSKTFVGKGKLEEIRDYLQLLFRFALNYNAY